MIDYPVLFALFAALAIGLYVALDGFDLGVGILFPLAPATSTRDAMMRSLAPMWDGNETWLVLGGMVLLAGFPGAFAILLPAFYVPLTLMLLGLVLRGVAFEFRSQGGSFEFAWTVAFSGGSVLAGFCQGATLGSFINGDVTAANGHYAGGPFDWLHVFSIATGFGTVAFYALLGAGWLIWRTDGNTQIFAREIGRLALLATGAAIALVSVWTPMVLPTVAGRWFSLPGMLYLAPLPILAVIAWVTTWRALWGARDWLPFAATIVLLLTALAGLGASIWPAAIPGVMTIWQASSVHRTQVIVAAALLAILPVILAYVGFSYWVFREKISAPPGLQKQY